MLPADDFDNGLRTVASHSGWTQRGNLCRYDVQTKWSGGVNTGENYRHFTLTIPPIALNSSNSYPAC